MNNKVLVQLYVVKLEECYDVFIPCNKKIKNALALIVTAISELTKGQYPVTNQVMLADRNTGQLYDSEKTFRELGILNGSQLLLI